MAKEEVKNEIIEKTQRKAIASNKEANSKIDTVDLKNTKTTKSKASSSTKKTTENSKKVAISKTKSSKSNNSKISNEKTKVSSTKKKTSPKKISKTNFRKPTAKQMLAEYYDLPYRYNQTIVKILAQTPNTLFVYWDISDDDKNSLRAIHGENFFYETRPILVVHNLTHNYSFDVEINDFANSWYIRTQEPNCNYVIELGRKYNNIQNEYVYINSSNNMMSPNNHILFENINLRNVIFKNTKTNIIYSKDFGSLNFLNNIDKLYENIYEVYSTLYNNEIFNELTNPSSGEFYLEK